MIQYIHSLRDKAILYRFLKQLDLYRNYLALAQYKTIQSDVIIDYTYNEKLLEFGEMIREILQKNNIMNPGI